jgi:hypothetical protein
MEQPALIGAVKSLLCVTLKSSLRLWCASTANQTNEMKSVHHAN